MNFTMKCANKKNCKNSFTPRYKNDKCCSPDCYKEYLLSENGKRYLSLVAKKAKKEVVKIDREKLKATKINTHSKENRKYLQDEINKLSRMIDERFGYDTCIDCGKNFGKQIDAAHYHSRGGNSTLKYNLHNLHSANSYCNQYSDKHKEGYGLGLAKRYGKDYSNYVIEQLPLIYTEIKLSNLEVFEILKKVRNIIRNFNSYSFKDAIEARRLLNEEIGIYPTTNA
jgi:hypothetical protein